MDIFLFVLWLDFVHLLISSYAVFLIHFLIALFQKWHRVLERLIYSKVEHFFFDGHELNFTSCNLAANRFWTFEARRKVSGHCDITSVLSKLTKWISNSLHCLRTSPFTQTASFIFGLLLFVQLFFAPHIHQPPAPVITDSSVSPAFHHDDQQHQQHQQRLSCFIRFCVSHITLNGSEMVVWQNATLLWHYTNAIAIMIISSKKL